MLGSRQMESVDKYLKLCKAKIEYHNTNASNANRYDSAFSIFNVICNASMALSMTIMTGLESQPLQVTITGGVFSFLMAISSKLKDNYNFSSLAFQHFSAADSYNELLITFKYLKVELEEGLINTVKIDAAIAKYVAIEQKSHIREIKCLKVCCFEK